MNKMSCMMMNKMISHIEVITKMYILTGSDTTHTQKLDPQFT